MEVDTKIIKLRFESGWEIELPYTGDLPTEKLVYNAQAIDYSITLFFEKGKNLSIPFDRPVPPEKIIFYNSRFKN